MATKKRSSKALTTIRRAARDAAEAKADALVERFFNAAKKELSMLIRLSPKTQ